ncbi:uncharacterized protein LOC122500550 isoform X2 [Leptopilina heterotoma]|uniref:uncharacterized protein LOC122500550 isoform X2 n=1 Tax=Leptopilina heterotoma TaxID=63436 RepID=UPI001CA9A411|nr:uncharacterized protein LOC122500550 isoform X2 [Leptopilina heterotoma]
MSREFYVPCTPYAYSVSSHFSTTDTLSCGSGTTDGVVVSAGGGMDCIPLRPGPFHYLINEQAKSLVALQELQNEVGALLEFRDLVIETFPNLRHKMAVSVANSSSANASVMSSTQSSHIPLPLSSPSSRRISDWDPGKVRRRAPREGETSATSSLPRSRSNSHSGGNKNSATVQDSGFSTETSSKDSASTAIPRPPSPRPVLDEAEDELWNLLDVIHRKGIRLREEVESLQGRLESVASEDFGLSGDVLEAVKRVTGSDDDDIDRVTCEKDTEVAELQREKLQLLDKVAELEAETISSRARAQELQSELSALSAIRTGLEDHLRAGTLDGSYAIHAPGAQRIQPISPVITTSSPKSNINIRSKGSAFASVLPTKTQKNRFRTRTIEKNVVANVVTRSIEDLNVEANVNDRRARLGALDSVLISPTRVANVREVDSKKIAAILREHSPLELQRHLITTTVHNQALQKRLDEVEKSTETLSVRLDKAREENDDLRFQLAERNIELEGTRARVRVLERFQQRPSTEGDSNTETESELPRCEQNCPEPGSSTESSRDHHQAVEVKPSPRRRPSRIPLLGVAKANAPKPPTTTTHARNDSRESLKSLTITRATRDSSRDSMTGKPISKTRDNSRESLNKSLSKTTERTNGSAKETGKDSLNKSLPRNNSNKDSLSKTSILSRTRDSLESNHLGSSSPVTPPRRPSAPARRSHSLARTTVDNDTGKAYSDAPDSWCSSSGSFHRSEFSLYPDSLNQETSSVTGSTRVEFIIGSPTRRFRPNAPWTPRYFDSIDSTAIALESLMTDEFPPRRGEALAECDSLERHPISSEV